jgi:hypothetical protein
MKAKFIYEAFEKKDKETAREDLLFPNKVIVEDSLSDIIEMITETLGNEVDGSNFGTSGHEENFEINEEIKIDERYSDYEGVCWESENGAVTKPILYTSIKANVDIGVEIEPYEPETRDYPGSPGGWELYGYLNSLKIFNGEIEKLNISKKENSDIWKVVQDRIGEWAGRMEAPDWDPY